MTVNCFIGRLAGCFRLFRNFKMVRIIVLFCFLFACSFSGFSQENILLNTIVIDAGHGGKDPGALGKIAKEKDIVLNVALKFGNLIKENMPEVKVIYTRSSDVFVPLDKRADIANKNNANLFVSIHANYVSSPKISGAETFVLGLHRSQDNLEVAKKENSVIVLEDNYISKYEGFDPSAAESYIVFELMQDRNLDQSIEVASKMQSHFSTTAQRYNRGVKQAGFLVLWQTSMPGVLVELGFLSNEDEEKYLISSAGQNNLANSLFHAFREFKQQYDAQNVLAPKAGDETKVSSSAKKSLENIEGEVIYKVQIASSSVLFAKGKGILAKVPDAQYYKDGNLYKYTVGETSNFNEISTLQKSLKAKVPDCFIVAFHRGKRITIREAQSIVNK